MKIYKAGQNQITLRGVTYYADADGIIDVPDNIHESAWAGQGFNVADGRLRELADEAAKKEVAVKDEPAPVAVSATPVTGSGKDEDQAHKPKK